MNRWLAGLLIAYGLLIIRAYHDARRIWRRERLLRAVVNGKR